MDILARIGLNPHARPSPVFRQFPPVMCIDADRSDIRPHEHEASSARRSAYQPPGKTLLHRALDSTSTSTNTSTSIVDGHNSVVATFCMTTSQQQLQQNSSATLRPMARASALPSVWLLGRFYSGDQWAEFYQDYVSRVWCTYRRGFVSLGRFNSDSGWGCMIRSGQMMLAESLIRHTIGRAWRLRDANGVLSTQHRPVLRMFLDHAAAGVCPFSIHELVKRGEEKYGKVPGDWYGAELISQVLADVMNGSSDAPGMGKAMGITMHVARGSVVYRDEIDNICSGGLAGAVAAGTAVAESAAAIAATAMKTSWNGQALFLSVPVRLGLRNLDNDYFPEIFEILKFPQSTGIIGGRPGHSLYFVGAVDANNRVQFDIRNRNGDIGSVSKSNSSNSHHGKGRRNPSPQLVYLDPHYEQAACKLSASFPNAEELQTYHQSQPLAVDIKNVDPGLAFGFYCRSPADLDDLWSRLIRFRSKNQGEPTFHLAATAPPNSLGYRYNSSAVLFDSDSGANDVGFEKSSSPSYMNRGSPERSNGSDNRRGRGGVTSEGNGNTDEWELL